MLRPLALALLGLLALDRAAEAGGRPAPGKRKVSALIDRVAADGTVLRRTVVFGGTRRAAASKQQLHRRDVAAGGKLYAVRDDGAAIHAAATGRGLDQRGQLELASVTERNDGSALVVFTRPGAEATPVAELHVTQGGRRVATRQVGGPAAHDLRVEVPGGLDKAALKALRNVAAGHRQMVSTRVIRVTNGLRAAATPMKRVLFTHPDRADHVGIGGGVGGPTWVPRAAIEAALEGTGGTATGLAPDGAVTIHVTASGDAVVIESPAESVQLARDAMHVFLARAFPRPQ